MSKETKLPKTQEEPEKRKAEVEALPKKLKDLSEKELAQVSGGSYAALALAQFS